MYYLVLMDLILIKENSNEWNYMWDWVYTHPLNEGQTALQVNSWQYKGSLRNGNKVLHQFIRGQKSLVLACSSGMTNEDIAKVIRLK